MEIAKPRSRRGIPQVKKLLVLNAAILQRLTSVVLSCSVSSNFVSSIKMTQFEGWHVHEM
jgi:hypothetical protein